MSRLLMRWLVASLSIAIVAWLLPGIEVGQGSDGVWTVLIGAVLLGLLNALVKPLLIILSCPLILLSLGLFLFVINAAVLVMASSLAQSLGFDFYVDSWGSAILGSVLMTIVSWALGAMLLQKQEEKDA